MDAAKEIINSPVVPIAMDSDSEMEVEEPVEAEVNGMPTIPNSF